MPWKETCPMHERLKFIVAASDETRTFVEVCAQFGISPKTGYKWLARYRALGPAGLEQRQPVARECPHRTPEELRDVIVGLRKERPFWGPKKLRAVLLRDHPEQTWPAASTIGDLLHREGLIRPRRRRVHVAPATQPLASCTRPNDTWCVDFKGHFALGDGARCYPLTITDGHSRYLIQCEGMLEPKGGPVRRAFERAFHEFGLPSRIRSDNGPPFATLAPGGLSMLSVWWIQLGIVPERIEPGQPQQNGRHERMHRTLKAEATQPPAPTLAAQQRVFDRFRHEYNDERPHEALGQTPPAQHYEPSPRAYPRELVVPSYGDDFKVRWVESTGRISWRSQPVLVHLSAARQPIGIRQVSETRHEAWYGPILLGTLDDRDPEPRLRRDGHATASTANGDGDGCAFDCGQPADGLPTAKPPSPDPAAAQ